VGNLTKDINIVYTKGGTAIGKFFVAVGDQRKQAEKYIDCTYFFECALIGKSAENLKPYLTKGRHVAICGKLRQETWQSQDQQKHSRIVVVVENVDYMDYQKQQQKPQEAQKSIQTAQSENTSSPSSAPESFDDDSIPF
jgi:single-strand DNA-binding protein